MTPASDAPASKGLARDTVLLAVGVVALMGLIATQVLGIGKLSRVPSNQLLADPGEGGRAAFNAMRAIQRGVITLPGDDGVAIRTGNITYRIRIGDNNEIVQWGGISDDAQANPDDLLPLRARRIYLQAPARARLANVTPDQIEKLRAIAQQPDPIPAGFRELAAELFKQRQAAAPDALASIDDKLIAHVEQLTGVNLDPIRQVNKERADAVRAILTTEQLNPPAAR
jgi:hypothetical protein